MNSIYCRNEKRHKITDTYCLVKEGAARMNGKPLFEHRPTHGSTKCTFEIKVKFLQNSTWQGEIVWSEQDLRQNFRSVLEMLKLMDEALANTVKEHQQVGWEE